MKTMYLLFAVLIFFKSFISQSSDGKNIKEIEIFSLPLSIETRTRVTEKTIHEYSILKHKIINDAKSISAIQQQLKKIKKNKDYQCLDIRVFCEIEYSNGEKDTLTIGTTELINYNNKTYRESKKLTQILYKLSD
jgi:hypothetical protein